MTKIVVDTWAWIEYLQGSLSGEKVKGIVENKENAIITPWFNIAEISSIVHRKNLDYKIISESIFSISEVFLGDVGFALAVGRRHSEIRTKIKDFGLGDACILAAAEKLNAKILTGDPHFKGMKNVIMI